MKIAPHYIKEAERIIKNYNKSIQELSVFEKSLADNKDMLLKLKNEIDVLKSSYDTDISKKQKLAEIMTNYDKEINRLQNIMMPYVTELEKLKKDSSILYGILKEKYPGASDKQLQEQIFKQLDEERNSSIS